MITKERALEIAKKYLGTDNLTADFEVFDLKGDIDFKPGCFIAESITGSNDEVSFISIYSKTGYIYQAHVVQAQEDAGEIVNFQILNCVVSKISQLNWVKCQLIGWHVSIN